MSAWLPVLLAGAAAGVLVLPPPSRLAGLGLASARVPPGRWRVPPAALVPTGLLVLWGLPAAALGLLATGLGRRALRARRARLAREAERAGAVEALTVLAGELGAGRSPATALVAAAGSATGAFQLALEGAAAGEQWGADPAAALLRGEDGSAVPDVLRGLAACWQVCCGTGSGLAAGVERLADGLRAEQDQRLAVDAELAGPRATAVLLAGLPVAGVGLAAGLGADPVHVLLGTPAGLGCLCVGVGLDLLGLWWTGRIVAAAGGAR